MSKMKLEEMIIYDPQGAISLLTKQKQYLYEALKASRAQFIIEHKRGIDYSVLIDICDKALAKAEGRD